MDSDDPPPPTCSCSCLCCGPAGRPSVAWRRSLKRNLSHLLTLSSAVPEIEFPRVDADSEAAALRDALAAHQRSVQDLHAELEAERSASASAASEAMSMILRLQREKADAVMEARQFRRFAEERIAHDQYETAALEDLLFKRDQIIQSLSCEIQAYKHRLASYGITGISVAEPNTPDSSTPRSAFDYPQLRCITSVPEPDTPMHLRRPSVDSFGTFPVWEESPRDDVSDRVYTIDAIHGPEYVSTPREWRGVGGDAEEGEIKKLYVRLQALEADRELMRQAILSMGTDKAQTVLLREIAQQLCKGPAPAPEKKIVRRPSFVWVFSICGVIKYITSFFFGRKKSTQCKYTFGMTRNNAGLLLLLEKCPLTRQRRLRSKKDDNVQI